MGEIKTDMFPEVLRMKARNRQENAKKNDRQDTQSNAAIPVETVVESIEQKKTDRG